MGTYRSVDRGMTPNAVCQPAFLLERLSDRLTHLVRHPPLLRHRESGLLGSAAGELRGPLPSDGIGCLRGIGRR
jgi:hypothetical protein